MRDTLSLLLLLTLGASLAVSVIAWQRRPALGATGLSLLAALTALWAGASLFQWVAMNGAPSLPLLVVRNIAVIGIPVAGVVLVLDYIGRYDWLAPRRIGWLLVITLAFLVAIATDPWHHLYLGNYPPSLLQYEGGPLFTLKIIYAYGLDLIGIGLLTAAVLRRPRTHTRQAAVMLIALSLPLAVSLAEAAHLRPITEMSVTPFAFALTNLLFAYALLRLGLFRIVPIARAHIMESTPEGFLVIDNERRLIDLNTSARDLLGFSATDIGRPVEDVLPGSISVIETIGTSLLTPDAEFTGTYPLGDRTLDISARRLVRRGRPMATVISLRDVTRREALERMQRDFVANFSHELRSPLAGLSLLAETIPGLIKADPTRASAYADRISLEVGRLEHLSEQMLALSRSEGMLASPESANWQVDLGALVHRVVETITPVADASGLTLSADVPTGVLIAGDPASLTAMVQSLIENAVAYTPAGGTVQVVVVEGANKAQGNQVTLIVQDDGVGMSPAETERIFERFYRGEQAQSRPAIGSGLGLSIAKGVADQHQGSIEVSSELGVGSRFTVVLPLDEQV